MRYYFCIYKDSKINKDFIKRNITTKQLKYTIRDYIYNVNNGRINKCEIPLLTSSLIYDIRNGRANKKYNIFKIFNNETELNEFLKKNGIDGIDIKDNNKVKLSNIMKYKPSNKTKLSNFYKNYDKKIIYDNNDDSYENIYIGEGNKKHLSKLLE